MTTTQNLHLPQWEKTDRIMMDDFNDAFDKIDTAIAGGAKIATGTYTGTGTYGNGNGITLTFPFVPKIVIIAKKNALTQDYRAVLLHGCTSATTNGYLTYCLDGITWDDAARSVSFYGSGGANSSAAAAGMNTENAQYLYLALA